MTRAPQQMPASREHGWLTADTPQPATYRPSLLGRTAKVGAKDMDRKKMPAPSVSALHDGAHARCVDHVKVEGLRKPVCILKGQEPSAVIAEARFLAGLT